MFNVLFRKELLETLRSYRWLWLPVFFLGLAMMQPITSYYMSDIIEQFGGLPEGAAIDFPLPSAEQVYGETLGQFTQIGTFILVLAFMGNLSSERKSGEAMLTLSKPANYYAYWLAKWTMAAVLTTVSFSVSTAAALYYIFILFEPIAASDAIFSASVYWVWLMFVVTVTLAWSTVSKRTGVAAAGALFTLLVLNIAASLFGTLTAWTPGILPGIAAGIDADLVLVPIVVTLVLIFILMTLSVQYMKKTDWLV